MDLDPLRLVLAVGTALIVILLAREIRSWRAGTRRVTRKQKLLRVVSACLALVIMAMIMAGDRWSAAYGPFAVMAYWTVCFGLAVSLVILALIDLKEVGEAYGEDRKRMLREIAKPGEKDENGE